MTKFLIIQTAFIGDVILATPLIEKIHQYFPLAQIDFLLRKGNEMILQSHPYINEIIIWDKKNNKYQNLIKVLKKIRKNRYDYIINCQRFLSTGIITAFSKAKFKVGFDKNPLSFTFTRRVNHEIGNGKHEIERNLQLIEHITDDRLVKPKLYPAKRDYENVKKYQEYPYICIAPASVWFTKQFPQDKWVKLIKKIIPKYKIYLIGNAGDYNFCEKIIENVGNTTNIENLAGKLKILETAILMQNAVMNYVNDSAPLHIASAMNAPVTAIFCSTIPEFGFGPLSDNSKVGQTSLSLSCRPCGIHGLKKCPEKHFKCAMSIKIEDIINDGTKN